MITVVTFKYRRPDYRTKYDGEHVTALRKMVAQHYRHPHRFVCITDDPSDLDQDTEYHPLWGDHFDLVNPSHPTARPNCYPRLKLFAPEMRDVFGERVVSLDLDMVIVDDLAPLWNRPDDFVIYDAKGDHHYNGSMFMLKTGTHSEIWENFHPKNSPELTAQARMKGSDQAWIRYCLAPRAATWTNADGAHSYLQIVARHPAHRQSKRKTTRVMGPPRYENPGALPRGARVVAFAGQYKPWDSRARSMSPWIRDHYPS
jgi:hypothetical protein